MIAWLFLKFGFGLVANVWLQRIDAFFSLIAKGVAFIFAHWRVFLPLAIAVLMWWKLDAVTTERDKAVADYASHLSEDKLASQLRDLDNEFKRKQGAADTLALRVRHRDEIAAILAKSNRKEANNAKDKAVSDRAISNYRDGLRLAIERETTATALRLSGHEQGGLAGGNSDAAVSRQLQEELSTCKEAGAVAAADYNFCKSYVNSEQKRIGVEK